MKTNRFWHRRSAFALRAAAMVGLALGISSGHAVAQEAEQFRRIATFPVFLNTDITTETVAEIVAASQDGMTLIYTDGANEGLGFIDITDPADPQPDGTVALGGEPTSVAVAGPYALASINTSPDFVNPSGELIVIDIATRAILATLPLGGQPDAIAVSPDGQFAAIAIENERDEDLGSGEPPQLPGGFLVIVDLIGTPDTWQTRTVDLVGVPDLFPNDPEPEFVDINASNQAVVTLQENNHLAIVDLVTGTVVDDFSARSVDLELIDTVEDDIIRQEDTLLAVPREPDAVAWIGPDVFATADEGDLFGGSRGFTLFGTNSETIFEAGNSLEHLAASLGHYPEDRSENKGNEPEGIEYANFGGTDYLFVGSERSSVIFVYALSGSGDRTTVEYLQTLAAGSAGPEGLLAIPSRDLFLVSAEEDEREDGIRSTVTIYQRGLEPNYPTIVSGDGDTPGVPIPWAALSGLVIDPVEATSGFTVHDSFYRESRIFRIDTTVTPAVIDGEIVLEDTNGQLLNALNDLKNQLDALQASTPDFVPGDLINDDDTVNLDLEGIALQPDGDFWIVSEGSGNLVDGFSDPDNRPFASPNLLLRVSPMGAIDDAILLPFSLTINQFRFGFEGVAIDEPNGVVYVAFQRAWTAAGDPNSKAARIGRYDLSSESWDFAFYPLDAVESANGGWVGVSDLALDVLGNLIVLERDNQANADAAVKRVYRFDPDSVGFITNDLPPPFETITKTLVRDILAEGDFDAAGGLVPEKLEGLAIDFNGDLLIVNDNDGVDDNSGETQLMRIPGVFPACPGDFNNDGVVDTIDLGIVLGGFGSVFDGDDLAALLDNFGCE